MKQETRIARIFLACAAMLSGCFLAGCGEEDRPKAEGAAPVIVSVAEADRETGEPIGGSSARITTEGDMQLIRVTGCAEIALLIKVKTKDAAADAVAVSGAAWIKISERTGQAETDGVQLFLVALDENKLSAGRMGIIVFSNRQHPQKKIAVTIGHQGNVSGEGADEFAPTIISVIGIDPMSDQPLGSPRHSATPPFTKVSVQTEQTYKLLFTVLGNHSPAVGRVVSGEDWLVLSETVNENPDRTQHFKLLVQANAGTNMRSGTIEFYNSADPNQKLLTAVIQSTGKEMEEPQNAKDRLVLNYVAEWNVDGNLNFIKSHNIAANQKALYSFEDARTMMGSPVSIEGIDYILPSALQWCAIVPIEGVYSRSDKPMYGLEETCMVGGRMVISANDYLNVKETYTTYAIRFKGDDEQQSAWRYTYTDNPEGEGKILLIEQVHMSEKDQWTVEDISNNTFWEQHHAQIVSRRFSTPGYAVGSFYTHKPTDEILHAGECGFYWSSDSAGEEQAWAMEVLEPQARTRDFYAKIDGHSIRPFKRTLMR